MTKSSTVLPVFRIDSAAVLSGRENGTKQEISRRLNPYLVALIVFFSTFFIQALLVKFFSVNMPFWDEWGATESRINDPKILFDYQNGTLEWWQLFDAHNEHRILTLRLILIGLFAVLGEWVPVANMLVSAVVCACTAAIWAYTMERSRIPSWISLIIPIILTLPSQFQNITWGFQISFYITVFGNIAGICIVVLSRKIGWFTIIASIFVCLLSTFSLASGMLSWIIVGTVLLLKSILIAPSLRKWLTNIFLWLKIFVFGASAIASIAFYFHNLQIPEDATDRAKNLRQLLSWLFMALSYPFVDMVSIPRFFRVAALLLIWSPIVLAFILALRYRENIVAQKHLLISCGIALFVGTNAVIIGYGRSGTIAPIPLASRYTTIFLWSGLLSIISSAYILSNKQIQLFAAKPFKLLLFLIVAGLLFAYANQGIIGLYSMEFHQTLRQQMKKNVEAYINDPSPAEKKDLAYPYPLPWKNVMTTILNKPDVITILPPEMLQATDPGGWIISGNAWTLNAVLPNMLGPGAPQVILGSWNSSDGATGRIESRPIQIEKKLLVLPVAGYPDIDKDTSLEIVAMDNPQKRIVYSDGVVGDHWKDWVVDVSMFRGQKVRIIAEDNSNQYHGWLGFGLPKQVNRTGFLMPVFKAFWQNLEFIAGTFIVLLLLGYLAPFNKEFLLAKKLYE